MCLREDSSAGSYFSSILPGIDAAPLHPKPCFVYCRGGETSGTAGRGAAELPVPRGQSLEGKAKSPVFSKNCTESRGPAEPRAPVVLGALFEQRDPGRPELILIRNWICILGEGGKGQIARVFLS